MKRLLLLCFLFSYAISAEAKHITGGELSYQYLRDGSAANTKVYRITLRLFRDENCSGCADMPASVSIGVFDNTGGTQVGGYITVNLARTNNVPLTTLPACITNPPAIDYRVGTYQFDITLNNNNAGYTASYQTCCRIDNIANIPNSSGATYTTRIPGANVIGNDASPLFAVNLSVMCFNRPFTLDFSATDADGDSLAYSFCSGLDGGNARDASYATPAPPPYSTLSYINGYSGGLPMGNRVSINPATGIISGIAPPSGKYVVSVCVRSYRNGVYISEHRKDLIVNVSDCDFAGVLLDPTYITCDGFTLSFSNQNNSPLNETFYWDFGDVGSGANNISFLENPSHTYSDTGVFTLKLVINRGRPCSDSTTAIVKVFPGYIPKFDVITSPVCIGIPVQFRDLTFARYGVVNAWKWDFGVANTLADTSILQNPTYAYSAAGTYTVTLDVGSSKGCQGDTVLDILIVDRAALQLTNDTLICSIDTLQLAASIPISGTITWSPNYNISSTSSFTPLVSPDVTTVYQLLLQDINGCRYVDSVEVKVVDFVTLSLRPDTTICKTDGVILPLQSDALYYTWTPPQTLNDGSIRNPVATPDENTIYSVFASIGKCNANGSIEVKVVPYPQVTISEDTAVCFGTSARLLASGGTIYEWSPTAFLNNPYIPNPIVRNPTTDIRYIVSVRDTLGCPKAVYDSVIVRMIRIIADAGPYDTSIVIGQPLQLLATGGVANATYTWRPDTWLNNPSIANPLGFPQESINYIVDIRSREGCFGTDTIRVKVFTTGPDIFVPSAFSPNKDGNNDDFKPIAVGMKSVDAFMVYNRWGQQLYASTNLRKGWDGTFKGKPQESGTYIWYAEATDYTGKKISKKGYVILIR